MPLRRASPIIFRTAESRTFIVDGERASMAARHSSSSVRESAGSEGEEVVEGFGVVAPLWGECNRVHDEPAQDGLGLGEGHGLRFLLAGAGAVKTSEFVIKRYYLRQATLPLAISID
jgi:hypothetical protein